MSENKKLSEKFLNVLKHEGVVTVMSWGVEPHIVNTWNSFMLLLTMNGFLFLLMALEKLNAI